MKKPSFTENRAKRIAQLTAWHEELRIDNFHAPYELCYCQVAGELRAMLRLDALAKKPKQEGARP